MNAQSAEKDAACPSPEPCDPDCECGPVHCPNFHLPRHKWHDHDRDPRPCPTCGEVCKYDGWGHVHASGVGIRSCVTSPGVGA